MQIGWLLLHGVLSWEYLPPPSHRSLYLFTNHHPSHHPTLQQGAQSVADLDKIRFASGHTPTASIRKAMQKTMQDHAAVYRTQESLAEGVVKIDQVSGVVVFGSGGVWGRMCVGGRRPTLHLGLA